MCDSPTGYLNSFRSKYVKIFECNSNTMDFKWYYTSDQLNLLSSVLTDVKISVIDHNNPNKSNNTYTVTSIIGNQGYGVGNLIYNRAFSHPYYFVTDNTTDRNWWNDVRNAWTGDERLLNVMTMNSTLQEFNKSDNYDFVNGIVYYNEYNTFNVWHIEASLINETLDTPVTGS